MGFAASPLFNIFWDNFQYGYKNSAFKTSLAFAFSHFVFFWKAKKVVGKVQTNVYCLELANSVIPLTHRDFQVGSKILTPTVNKKSQKFSVINIVDIESIKSS
jgi:hypothetical protein